jgi:CHASE2 domain-containing sensor protein
MNKLVVLKLDGDLEEHGFRVTLEIGAENARPDLETCGNLPASPDLAATLNQWRTNYCSLAINSRIKPKEIIYGGSINRRVNECSQTANDLRERLQTWLKSEEFRQINNTLREELKRDERIRLLICTDNQHLQNLPWQEWDFFHKYSLAEYALSTKDFQATTKPKPNPKVKILAILGNSNGINLKKDRDLLENLPDSETVFLVEPQRNELNKHLWQQWDILFFAGHSETENDTGWIYINQSKSLTIDELKYGLKHAISQGLQLAIFNSCDGLGLARQLASLHIPQMIVMRSPVPDVVAQEFLNHFLLAYSGGKSLYLATRQAREMLQGLEDKFPKASWLPVIFQNPTVVPPTWKDLLRLRKPPKRRFITVLITSLLIAALVMGVRHQGMLQTSELHAFDHLMRLRPEEKPDPRLLIITVDDADIQYQIQRKMNMRWSISDGALAKLLSELDRYQPTTIGIDIYRDFGVDSDYPDLATRLQQDERIFAVCKVAAPEDGAPDGTFPPPEVPEKRLSFSDFVADEDEIARRQLLHMKPLLTSRCGAQQALSLQLALHYLQAQGYDAQINSQGNLEIGNVVRQRRVVFPQLQPHTSGYQGIDARGYQILLNYRSLRSPQNIAQQVSVRDVLDNRINPNLKESLKNPIVLIGVTAPTTTDYWKTPESPRAPANEKRIPGVFVQAHMISHIISAVMERRPLLWWWNVWQEALWVWVWTLIGAVIALRLRQPLYLGLAVAGALLTLFAICFAVLLTGGWIPLVPAALALLVCAVVLKVQPRLRLGNSNTHLESE